MKKFVFLHVGFEPPTDAVMQAWGQWFASLGDKIVDPGSPLVAGREITHAGTKELAIDKDAITGYTVISAASLDEAEQIAKTCPIITSMRIYETRSM